MEQSVCSRPQAMLDAPMSYCPGCGHATMHRIIAEVLVELGIRERTIGIAPVGCAVTAYDFVDIDWTEAAHGRPPAVATGIKRVRPQNIVFTYQGDGDLASIGMAEIIHAANRGEQFCVFFINNTVYAMTQGQMAPTTLAGQRTTTSPRGRDVATMGHPIRVCELLDTLQAPAFLARTTITRPRLVRRTKELVRKCFRYQMDGVGFTLLEILSPCPTYWRMTPVECLRHIDEKLVETFPLGVLRDAADPDAVDYAGADNQEETAR